MNLFFDTSSLFKLYHKEEGTEKLIDFFTSNTIDSIYLSDIKRIVFCSAILKKCRKQEISENISKSLIEKFEIDSANYRFVNQSEQLIMLYKKLIENHWKDGLRTLYSIQLASVLVLKDIDFFFTSENVLSEIAKREGLNVI